MAFDEANGSVAMQGAMQGRRPKRLPREVRERQILDAAVQVFAKHGYHAASMDEISATAGISKPMIYSYLGSKEDLFAACIRREVSRMLESIVASARPGLPADQQLWLGVLAFFEFVGQNTASWQIVHRQSSVQGGPFAAEYHQMRGRAIELVASLLITAATEAEQERVGHTAQRTGESLAAALVGAGESMADWWADHPDETAERLAERMMNVVWAGFGNLVAGQFWVPPQQAPQSQTSS